MRQQSLHLRNPPSEHGRYASKLLDRLGKPFDRAANDDDEIGSAREELRMEPKCLAHDPLRTIAHDGAPELSGSGDSEPRGSLIGTSHDEDDVMGRRHSPAAGLNPEIVRSFADTPLGGESKRTLSETVRLPGHGADYFLYVEIASRLRPLRRRLARIFWPAAVFMRARKPCVRRRRVLCGW